MTKADVINMIVIKTGNDVDSVTRILEAMFKSVKQNVSEGRSIYIRGFASFVIKKRAAKVARNITANTSMVVGEHYIPYFRVAKEFKESVKKKVKKASDNTDND